MNPTDPKFLRTHIRRPRNIKRRFSAALALWWAYRKRPAGGCAGAGTHLHRATERAGSWPRLAPSPSPSPLLGRPWVRFFAESADQWEGGQRAAEGARKKKQKREKEAESAAAAAPEGGSESDKKPLGRPPGRKDVTGPPARNPGANQSVRTMMDFFD